MAEGRILRELIKAASPTASPAFLRAAETLIAEERQKKHHLLANDLERILYGTDKRGESVYTPPKDVPTDRERGLPLMDVTVPVRDFEDLVMSADNGAILQEVLLEQNRAEILQNYGLRPMSRLLFCGPPGNGKTASAEALATELSWEFVLVRFDAVVSSFLGETAANLRKVFDFIERRQYVVLFDEFDAIGKERADAAEHGELKRVVNAFLQMLDGYRGQSILIAATNHENMLDSAIWRRFDEVLVFPRPNLEQIRHVLEVKLRGVRHDLPLEDRGFVAQFRGLAFADVERVIIRAVKSMILSGREFLTVQFVEESLRREEHRMRVLAHRESNNE